MYLIVDTETNGKIIDYKQPMSNVDNFPRIAELAMALYDDTGMELGSFCFMIKPDGWTIPKEDFFINNGMSTERCEREGIPIKEALQILSDGINNCEYFICHNIGFDYPVIGAEMIRAGIKPKKKPQKVCTMMSTIKFVEAKYPSGRAGFKFPKLVELHEKLFGTGIEDAHTALGDVKTTARCFFALLERGLIDLTPKEQKLKISQNDL